MDEGSPARLSGGKEIPASCFVELHTSQSRTLHRISEYVHGHIIAVDLVGCLGLRLPLPSLLSYGFSEPVLPAFPQLYMDHTPLVLARWPNVGEDFLRTGAVLDRGAVIRDGNLTKRGFSFQVQPEVQERASTWGSSDRTTPLSAADNVWMMGYWTHDWAEQAVQLSSLSSRAAQSVQPSHYGVREGARYYFYNVPEELDHPGEYFISEDGWLWVYPPHPYVSERVAEDAKKAQQLYGISSTARTSRQSHLYLSLSPHPVLQLSSVQHLHLHHLVVELTRGSGIRLLDAQHVTLDSLVVRRIGNVGIMCGHGAPLQGQYMAGEAAGGGGEDADADVVVGFMGQGVYHKNFLDPLWNRQCGTCITVSHCHMHELGAGGIIMGGGDRVSLTAGHNLVANCHIHSFSLLWTTYRPAVWLDGVGNALTHNVISNAPHTAVLLNGNDHVVEYNDISEVCEDTADVGVIYTGRDWTQRGHLIRYNFIHHISALVAAPSATTSGNVTYTQVGVDASGVYFDDLSSGSTVAHNLFYRVHRAVLLGGGRDHTVIDNVIIQAETPIHYDARAVTSHKTLVAPDSVLFRRLDATPVASPAWAERYPSLSSLRSRSPERPMGNVIERNVMIGSGRMWVVREVESGVGLNWAGGSETAEDDDHCLVKVRGLGANVTFVRDDRVVSVRDRLYRLLDSRPGAQVRDAGETGREGHRHVRFERCEVSTWMRAADVVIDYEEIRRATGWALETIPVDQIGPCCMRGQRAHASDEPTRHHDSVA